MVAKVLLALLTVLSLCCLFQKYQPSGSYLSNHCKTKDFGYFELCLLEMSSTQLMSQVVWGIPKGECRSGKSPDNPPDAS